MEPKVLYRLGKSYSGCWNVENAGLHCSDPVKNEWKVKATTCKPHFGSSLFCSKQQNLCCRGGMILLTPMMFCRITLHLKKLIIRKTTLGLLLNKDIFPKTIFVQWKQKGGCIASSTYFQLAVGLESHQESCIPFICVNGAIWVKSTQTAVLCYRPESASKERVSLKTE